MTESRRNELAERTHLYPRLTLLHNQKRTSLHVTKMNHLTVPYHKCNCHRAPKKHQTKRNVYWVYCDTLIIVRFTMYFCSEFMEICKHIHFWKAY